MDYYNDNDPRSAAWLQELIKQHIIPPGDVDERSIKNVTGSDLKGYTQCHFFAGIGGWSEALRLAGWPADHPVWTGSCPCQPFSCAGQRKGEKDERHLWPEFRRLIAECNPPIVFGEQVASKDGRLWLSGVRTDLETLGYAVGAADLCAAGVGAPHIRQRLYWVADAQNGDGWTQQQKAGTECRRGGSAGSGDACRMADAMRGRYKSQRQSRQEFNFEGSGRIGGMADAERSERWPNQPDNERDGGDAGRNETPGVFGACCEDGGMEYTAGDGRDTRRTKSDGRSTPGGCGTCRVVNPNNSGRPQYRGPESNETEQCAVELRGNFSGVGDTDSQGSTELKRRWNTSERSPETDSIDFWHNSIWLPCADGKARRIEPGIFPLVDGLPGRVGILRGAGNAIVPQVAAEFIKAYMDINFGG